MPDYQTLYFELFHAMEQAIRILIAAQQSCKEHYLAETEEEDHTPSAENEVQPKVPPHRRCGYQPSAGIRPLSRRGSMGHRPLQGAQNPHRIKMPGRGSVRAFF